MKMIMAIVGKDDEMETSAQLMAKDRNQRRFSEKETCDSDDRYRG